MLAQHQRNSNIFVGLGLVGQIAGRIMIDRDGGSLRMLGIVLAVAGLAAFVWGCAEFARAKGHSPAWGLLGLFSLLGLLVLLILRDRHPEGEVSPASQPGPPPVFGSGSSEPPADADR